MQSPFSRYRQHLLVAAVSLLAVSAACAPYAAMQPAPRQAPAPAQSGAQAVAQPGAAVTQQTITATEFAFSPKSIQVPLGQKITLTLENKGSIEHDLSIDALGVKLVAKPGQSVSGSFTADKAGTYDIICSVPGHKEAGMKGTLVAGTAAASQPATSSTMPGMQTGGQPPADVKPLPAGLTKLPLPQVAAPLVRTAPAHVRFDLETQEVTALLDNGVATTLWTFNGTIPGPMLRVKQGDTVEIHLKNSAASAATHSIDLHAVTGPGGGAKVMQVPPGGEGSFEFKALNPGVYIYHCATPPVAHHISSGMYGMIVVEPPEGLPKVDHEYYIMQGDYYLQGERGQQGVRAFDMQKMLDERPDYVLFNGGVGQLTGAGALKAKVGETVRVFFGVGGPNLSSSFHIIGEIFDRVYPDGATDPVLHNVQTTTVPAGGATMVEFKTEVPGSYTIVDHSLGRLEKGGAGILEVTGDDNPSVFRSLQNPGAPAAGH